MARLRLELFGGFRLLKEGAPIALRSRKAQALIAYLALTPKRWHDREALSDLLWADRSDVQARQSLRQTLTALRKALGAEATELLEATGEAVRLNRAKLDLDVGEFEEALAAGSPDVALALFKGELLAGITVRAAPFEDWLAGERARLEARAGEAMEARALELSEQGEHRPAIDLARRLLALDPLREASHRLLMELSSRAGDRAGALSQYRACERMLARELQIEPSAETRALYDALVRRSDGTDDGHDAAIPSTPAKAVTDKPSIAVLPFENFSEDKTQQYFSDGIAEDIITGLSRINWLFVVARNSSFAYRDTDASIPMVGAELGVRYVLRGSVRRGGDSVRVTAQLVDAGTGVQVWADRYHGELKDVFALQDEITAGIIAAMVPEVTSAEIAKAQRDRPDSVQAWDTYLRALPYLNTLTAASQERAVELLTAACKAEPGFAEPHAALARSWVLSGIHGWAGRGSDSLANASEAAARAIELDPTNASAHCAMSLALSSSGDAERAAGVAQRALELDPNLCEAHGLLAWSLALLGRGDEALTAARRALLGSPRDPLRWMWFHAIANAEFAAARYGEAIAAAEKTIVERPQWAGSYLIKAASAAHTGDLDAAGKAAEQLQRLIPRFSVSGVEKNPMWTRSQDIERLVEGLRRAGLPG